MHARIRIFYKRLELSVLNIKTIQFKVFKQGSINNQLKKFYSKLEVTKKILSDNLFQCLIQINYIIEKLLFTNLKVNLKNVVDFIYLDRKVKLLT